MVGKAREIGRRPGKTTELQRQRMEAMKTILAPKCLHASRECARNGRMISRSSFIPPAGDSTVMLQSGVDDKMMH